MYSFFYLDPSILDGPTWHGSSFLELDKAVVCVITQRNINEGLPRQPFCFFDDSTDVGNLISGSLSFLNPASTSGSSCIAEAWLGEF